MDTQELERFWGKVMPQESGCWLWTGCILRPGGYGQFCDSKRKGRLAHRYSYEASVGPIPQGLTIDHLCRNRWCVNPDHLEPVTIQENLFRARMATTHCPSGHPYDTPPVQNQRRTCAVCRTASTHAHWRRVGRGQGPLRGEKNPSSVLTADAVVEIRRMHAAGASLPACAARFSVDTSTAHRIVQRKAWTHV